MGPTLDLRQPNPLAISLERMLGGVSQGLQQGYNDRTLQNIAAQIDVNDPRAVQQALFATPSHLRPELATLLQTSMQAQQTQEQRQREKERFDMEKERNVQQRRLGELEISDIERRRDKEFTDLVTQKLQWEGITDLDRSAFVDMSQKYNSELNPDIRYQKTLKDFEKQTKAINNIANRINKIGTFRKGFLGLKESDLDTIASDIDKARKSGFDPRLIEQSIKQLGLSNKDFEAVMTPNFSKVKKIANAVKPPKRKVIQGQAGISGSQPEVTDTDIANIATKFKKAINLGASLDYLYSTLIEKGYSEQDAQTIIRDATIGEDLTARQELQLNNLQRQRQRLLGSILGAGA